MESRERERARGSKLEETRTDLGEQTDWNVLRGLFPKHPSPFSLSLFSFLVPAQSSLDKLTTIRVRRVSALPDLYFLYLA